MLEVRFSDPAIGDLSEIAAYIGRDNPHAARQLVLVIRETCRSLAMHPLTGRSRDDLLPGSRSFPVGKYLIFYQVARDHLDILRIVHGGRDLRAIFPE